MSSQGINRAVWQRGHLRAQPSNRGDVLHTRGKGGRQDGKIGRPRARARASVHVRARAHA